MIVVFGSVNIDVIHAVPALPKPGETVIGTGLRLEPGGKGASQAAAAARDGALVAFAGAVGPDGAAALAGLQIAGVDTSRVAHTGEPTGIASICVDTAGRNQIVVGSGANRLASAAQVLDSDLGPQTTLVLQMEVDPAQTAMLIRRARVRGSRILLNLAPAGQIPADALGMVDWLVMNEAEAAWFANSGHSYTGNVIRTLGERGVDVLSGRGAQRIAGHCVSVVDTTGAGDCFMGVFAAALDRGESVAAAAGRANVAASISCTRHGCQSSYPDATETMAHASTIPGTAT